MDILVLNIWDKRASTERSREKGIAASDGTRTRSLLRDRPALHTQAAPVDSLCAVPSAMVSND
jgi:hypothetical protein